MHRLPVVVSGKARQDLSEIRAYHRQVAGAVVSARILKRIRDALARIGRAPRAGSVHTEFGGDVRLRSAPPYVIYVEIHEDRAVVLRILHRAQNRDAIMKSAKD